MKFIKYILFLLLIATIGISIYIAVQPNAFTVLTTKTIQAPAAVIYETIMDTTNTDRSGFWKKTEQLQSVSSNPPLSIEQYYKSKHIGDSELTWLLEPQNEGNTIVNRTLTAKKLSFIYKAKSFFLGDKVEKFNDQLNKDLEQLDKDVSNSMKVYSIKIDGLTEYGGGFYMYKTTSSTASNISNMMGQQYGQISKFMNVHNIQMTGMPFTIYNTMNEDGSVIMSNAIPVQNKITVAENSNILCGYMDRTRVLKATLKGNYTNLGEAWQTAMQYLKDNNLEAAEQPVFEIYTNDPGDVPNPANYITELYIPLKTEPVESEQL